MDDEEKLLEFDMHSAGKTQSVNVRIELGCYEGTRNICMNLYSDEIDGMDNFLTVTENLFVPVERNQAYLCPGYPLTDVLDFLKKYDLGELAGETRCSGILTYPLFTFKEEKLKKYDPDGYRIYEKMQMQEEPLQTVKDPEKIRTLEYKWNYGDEELAISVGTYSYGKGIYIGLYSRQEGEWDSYGDLTVNLPGYCLEPNEAFIDGFCSQEKLEFIKQHKLGKVLPQKGRSGMGQYAVVAFDLDRLAQFDRVGVEKLRQENGLLEIPQKEAKHKKSR